MPSESVFLPKKFPVASAYAGTAGAFSAIASCQYADGKRLATLDVSWVICMICMRSPLPYILRDLVLRYSADGRFVVPFCANRQRYHGCFRERVYDKSTRKLCVNWKLAKVTFVILLEVTWTLLRPRIFYFWKAIHVRPFACLEISNPFLGLFLFLPRF